MRKHPSLSYAPSSPAEPKRRARLLRLGLPLFFLLLLSAVRSTHADISVYPGENAILDMPPGTDVASLNLSGEIKSTEPLVDIHWMASPTKPVTFEDEVSAITTATFSQTGSYILTLYARNAADEEQSASMTVTVRQRPVITNQPQDSTVLAGAAVSFTVGVADGYPTPTQYQWARNSTPIPGATQATYALSSTSLADDGAVFRVTVSNASGSETSSPATLRVVAAPTISQHPQSLTVNPGSTATFTVTATGSAPLSYRWYRNDTAINGNNGAAASYSVTANQAVNGNRYHCIVTNAWGNAVSTAAILTVRTPPAFTNTVWQATGVAGQPLSFQLTASGTAPITFGSTELPAGLAINASTGLIAGTPTTGGSYTVTVSASNLAGQVTHALGFSISAAPTPPTITQDPRDTTVVAGSTVVFTTAATGTPAPTYTWQRNQVTLAGQSGPSYSFIAGIADNNASYRVIASNGNNPPDTSAAALLTVRYKPRITTQPQAVSVTAGQTATFSVTAVGNPNTLTYRWYRNDTLISSGSGAGATYSVLTTLALNQSTYQCMVSNAVGDSVSAKALLTVTVLPAPPVITTDPRDTTVNEGQTVTLKIAVTGSPAPSIAWQRNGITLSGQTSTTLSFSAASTDNGARYRAIASNGLNPPDTSLAAVVAVRFRPRISAQPRDTAVSDGQTARFTVVADGNPAPSYQWMRNDSVIAGVPTNSATYTTGNLNLSQSGNRYSVRVFNAVGDSTSASAMLTVNPIPVSIVTHPANVSVTEGNSATFSVVAQGSGLTYQWRRNNVNITTNGNGSSYTLAATALTDSGAKFNCIVTGVTGTSVTSNQATLSVQRLVTAPKITNTNFNFNTTVNRASSFAITATGTAPLTFAAANLPPGLGINASTGLISGTPTVVATTQVTLSVTNSAGTDSRTLTITVAPQPVAPTINSALSVATALNANFSYTITASGTAPFTFTASPLPAGLTFSGNTISGKPTTLGQTTVVLKATNEVGTDTKNLIITVNPANQAPVFTLNLPDSLIRREKSSLTLTVTATGYPAPTYQWQYLATPQSAPTALGTGSSYSIASLTTVAKGYYRVIASNASGSATSKLCTLTVRPKPSFSQQPPAQITVTAGGTATFSVIATATPPVYYQWKTNGYTDIPGATSATLVLNNVTPAQAGDYRCMAWGSDVDWKDTNSFSFSTPSKLIVNLKKIDIPKANYGNRDTTFTAPLLITVQTDTVGDTLRYTLDGQNPTLQSPIFSAGMVLTVKSTTTLKAQAFKAGLAPSDVMTRTYTYIDPGVVTLPDNLDSVIYGGTKVVRLKPIPGDAVIWYTLNGDVPTENGATALKYDTATGILIPGPMVLKARAFKAPMTPSLILTKRFVMETLPKAATPTISPSNPRFQDVVAVLLTSATDQATIWYTLDGSSPYTSPTRIGITPNSNTVFPISATTTIKAFAEQANHEPSDSLVFTYYRIPGPIQLTPPGDTEFTQPLTVQFSIQPQGTPIYCTFDGSEPLDVDLAPTPEARKVGDTLVISGPTTMRCVAIGDDKIPSDTLLRFYTWNVPGNVLPPPVASPTGRSFKNSLQVVLNASNDKMKIQYTTQGEDPEGPSAKTYVPNKPIVIDTTVTLRAVAVDPSGKYSNSRLMVQTYTLAPDTPYTTPSPGVYVGPQKVVLKDSSSRVQIYYTFGEQAPTPETATLYKQGDTLDIAASAVLKAIAVAGNLASPVRYANFTILDSSTQVLLPDSSLSIEGTAITLYHHGQPPVGIEVRTTAMQAVLPGFTDISFALGLRAIWPSGSDTTDFPDIFFRKPIEERRTLYRIDPTGKILFVSSADSVRLQTGGTYFLAKDTLPPTVEWVGEKVLSNDSTEIRFTVRDNVSNLLYDFSRSDAPAKSEVRAPVMASTELVFRLKSPPGDLQPIKVSLTLSDGTFSIRLPSGANQSLILSQVVQNAQGSGRVRLGLKSSRGWDLISLPLQPATPLTVGALWSANPEASKRKSAGYKAGSPGVVTLGDADILHPGQGYWLASEPKLNDLKLPNLLTASIGQNEVRVTLKNGWNLIGVPLPVKMYWPIPRSQGTLFLRSFVKAPWGFIPETDSYIPSDSLEPWRGYWVYSYADKDTVITLSQIPVVTPNRKVSEAAGQGLSKEGLGATSVALAASFSRGQALILGAYYGAEDGASIEDEPSIPESDPRLPYLVAARGRRALQCDWVDYRPGSLLQWKLVQKNNGVTSADLIENDARISMRADKLPTGYAAAVVSTQRRIQYPIREATEIPPTLGGDDTLTVWAAPEALLKRALQGFTAGPPPFAAQLLRGSRELALKLDLPEAAHIQWLVCDARGRILRQGLESKAEGRHQLKILADRQPTGILFLRAEVHGRQLHRSLSYRFTSLP